VVTAPASEHEAVLSGSEPRPVVRATDREGCEHLIAALPGRSLMISLKYEGNLDVAADCGGNCFCGTCHVYVDPDWLDHLPPQGEDEVELLDELLHSTDRSRLACQIRVDESLEGLRLKLAPRE
jgi:2Fe-2S ferredoxin